MNQPGLPLHPACLSPQLLLEDCDIRRSRATGPGGQHRNKVETAITLTHKPTGLQGSATERRSQAQNQAMALTRLRVTLAIRHRCEVTLKADAQGKLTGVMAARWYARVKQNRLMLNPDHEDFPAILAWVMDLLWVKELQVPAVAGLLGVTSTQIIKLLRQEPAALEAVNKSRSSRGMHPLK